MIYLVADVETTGFKPWWHDVISCGLVIKNSEHETLATFYDTCKPWIPANYNPDSSIAHGFTLHEMMQFQPPELLAKKILHFIAPFRTEGAYMPWVAHHNQMSFDFLFLQNLFVKSALQFSFYKCFNLSHAESTIQMGKAAGYDENNLKSWAMRLGKTFNHHNALDDALMCAEVYKFLTVKKGANLEFKSEPKQKAKFHKQRAGKADSSNNSAEHSGEFTLI
jgi:DNA polymerase III epsilon subunit-like protein